jgi:predicted dinucleotide-binding enzyme
LIGAVPALLIFQQPFGFNAILGLIGLSGILMRNTLILIGQIHSNQADGLDPYHAVIEATVQRSRPVILTALAAVLAFIPLTNSVFWGSMAYVLIGGTAVGTVLTLAFLPALYAIWFRVSDVDAVIDSSTGGKVNMDIGIIGSGNIGSTLARRLTALGHQVLIANSRGPASLAAVAAETGATAATVEQSARAQDVVIIAVPEAAAPKLPRDILAATSAVVVDTGNYYPSRDGRIAEIEGGLTDSEWVARVLGVPVVKAFNNIVADSLATRGVPAGTPGRICLSVAGDDPRAKELVLSLINALGFDGIDAGTLADSWRQQPGTPAYCRDLDADALKAALAQADAGQIAGYRAQADDVARPYFAKKFQLD